MPVHSLDVVARNLRDRKGATGHPRAAARKMVAAVADAYEGRPPRDDATVLCLDWYGPPSGSRRAIT
ncbi:hypothetical protein ACFVRB_33465 [Streptomyces nojiriensis]|uniref:hypothetical protein n=1 Tax=Streptomyces nojiriensis TaxID=66374 RepID=UPI0036D94F1E